MQLEDMILISVDDHIVEPPDMFKNHLTDEWKDKAPKLAKVNGTDVWQFNGQNLPNIGLNAVVGRVPEEYGVEPTAYDQMRKGCYDVHSRVDDMNANGVLAQICFPSFPGFVGQLWATCEDKTQARVMLQAYNDWHIDEWCGSAPGRFIPLALPAFWDPKVMAEEVHRVAKKGCRTVNFSENPTKLGQPSLHDEYWDPFWKACEDEGMVICIHIGSGGGMNFTTMDAPIDVMITTTPVQIINLAADLLFSKVLKKFPGIKFALSEGGIGWVPYFLERADYVYKHHHAWTNSDFGGKLPSEVFRERFFNCFIDDKAGIQMRDLIGVETIMWECDYPHSDTTWPDAPEVLWESLEGVSDEDIHAMTWKNAAREFGYEFSAELPQEKATVGELRKLAKDVDLTLMKGLGGNAAAGPGEVVTAEHIVNQLATAFVQE
jgi:predicted TIM-barrel fold metal-dependent hydrolase